MSTRAQRAANPRNAQSSTGPVTDAGKQASSQNSRTHGCSTSVDFSVLPNEDPHDFAQLVKRITFEMQPATEHEGFLVTLMAQARWKRGRIQFHETDLLNRLIAGEPVESKVALMMRYAADAERAYYRAHREYIHSRSQQEKHQAATANAAFARSTAAPVGQPPDLTSEFLECHQAFASTPLASFGETEATLRI